MEEPPQRHHEDHGPVDVAASPKDDEGVGTPKRSKRPPAAEAPSPGAAEREKRTRKKPEAFKPAEPAKSGEVVIKQVSVAADRGPGPQQ